MYYKLTIKGGSDVVVPVVELNSRMYGGKNRRVIPDATFRGRLASIQKEYPGTVDWEMIEDEDAKAFCKICNTNYWLQLLKRRKV